MGEEGGWNKQINKWYDLSHCWQRLNCPNVLQIPALKLDWGGGGGGAVWNKLSLSQ